MMTRTFFLLQYLLFVAICVYAQTTKYTLSKSRTAPIIAKYVPGTFQAYRVVNKEVSFPIYDTISKITPEYAELSSRLEKLHNDSASYATQYQNELTAYNEISKAAEQIGNYLNKTGKFRDKSHFLAEAQTTFIKYNLDYLVYADDNVNSIRKKEFKGLRFNDITTPDSFDNHLRNVYNQIKGKSRPYNNSSNINYDLQRTRRNLSQTQRYSITYKESGQKKQIKTYMVDSEIEDLTSIEGVFTSIGEFYFSTENTLAYLENQLIEKSFLESQNEKNSRHFSPLFYNSLKNEYYLDAGRMNFTYECGTNQEISDIITKINKAGYKTLDSKGDYIIQTPNGNITLTADILEQVKINNTKYISDISLSVKTFNSLLTESKPLIDKLANHFNAYSARTMTTDRLSIWKQDVVKADVILKKMNSLKGAEKENIYNFNNQFSNDRLKLYNDFWGVVVGSKQILGL
jgi:hypothetical protein